ncbi:MAG: ATP-dependent DNA helicase RecG [Defluviitaleaceae bacterium]|nr:ATP-dependent DNA helicase RecG [Defluviitaleaceae bacterium]
MEKADLIIKIKNVGTKRAKEFLELGIETINDLLHYFPKNYKSREIVKKIEDVSENETVNLLGYVTNISNYYKGKISITSIKIKDNTGSIDAIFFGMPYISRNLSKNTIYLFSGKTSYIGKKLVLSNPEYEKETDSIDEILPIYKFHSQKIIRKIVKTALNEIEQINFQKSLPKILKKNIELIDIKTAFKNIHFPKNLEILELARRYFATEEILKLQISLYELRKKIKKPSNINIKNYDISKLKIPFSLTNSQKNVLREIIKDISSKSVMYRLLQGDVGSGKTIISIILSYIFANSDYQVAVMVPTSILANQHFQSFFELLSPLGIEIAILTGNTKNKKELLEKIRTSQIKIVIGTHALFSENVKFENLGLVITDEQHRFGVSQREALEKKGNNPHVLVMSATPIPRSLALVIYGDMDISIIDEVPKNRQKISTYAVTSSYRYRLWNFIKKEIEQGHKVYIVCPIIDKSENMESVLDYKENIVKYYKKQKEDISDKIDIIHGKMNEDEKEKIMNSFIYGDLSILISTTVIEVGINSPKATLIIIEDAHRFGISQLHQLRGRVGRSSLKSYCVLVSDVQNKESKERIRAMTKNSDGFELSKIDLKIRGPGDFFGDKQHGFLNFKMFDLQKDMDIIKVINENIEEIYKIYKN